MTSFGASARPLNFCAALAAPKPIPSALALGNLRGPMLLAYRSGPTGIAAMHSAMFGGINRLDMFRATTRGPVAGVVNVLPSRAIQRLVDEAVNPSHAVADPDKTVAVGIPRAGPNPALTVDAQSII